MNENSAIVLEQVGLAYPQRTGLLSKSDTWVLNDISFELHRGETLGVIGRNGAGKSSLLRLLARIGKPSRGNLQTASDFIALLSLNLGFMNELTGRKNILLSGMLYGLSRQEMENLVDEIIEYSELGIHIDKPVGTYSSGMKARLGFATATAVNPDVLLIDEILGVGDLAFREKSSATLAERLASSRTAVLVSHSLNQVRKMCDRVLWLEGGELKRLGEPEPVVSEYEAFMSGDGSKQVQD